MTLLGWKQLAKWSLEHSCMSPSELTLVTKEWEKRWMGFCQWIVDEYGERMANWEPAPGRH
jgi:adenosine deaminase CECR1